MDCVSYRLLEFENEGWHEPHTPLCTPRLSSVKQDNTALSLLTELRFLIYWPGRTAITQRSLNIQCRCNIALSIPSKEKVIGIKCNEETIANWLFFSKNLTNFSMITHRQFLLHLQPNLTYKHIPVFFLQWIVPRLALFNHQIFFTKESLDILVFCDSLASLLFHHGTAWGVTS